MIRISTISGTLNFERQTLHVDDDKKKVALVETKTVENGTPITTPVSEIRYQYDNHLGSACLELDTTANMISYEEYHPFGTTSYRSGSSEAEVSLKRYKYVGKERDEETGLYYYGARYYAGWIARFVSVDPLREKYPELTPFQYASNRPIIGIDLDGLEVYYSQDGTKIGQYGKSKEVRVVNADALSKTKTQFDEYNKALKTNPNVTDNYLSQTLSSSGSVTYKDYFTAVTDVVNSELKKYSTYGDCMKASKAQMTAANVTLSGEKINTIVDTKLQPTLSADPIGGSIYVQTQLKAGHPVLIGVQETKTGETSSSTSKNSNQVTSHFMVIVGTDISAAGEISFRYYDNGTSKFGKSEDNKLVLDTTTGRAQDTTPANPNFSDYKLSEVRKNK